MDIVHVIDIKATPERVFQAITTRETLLDGGSRRPKPRLKSARSS